MRRPTTTTPSRGVFLATVADNRQVCDEHFVLRVDVPHLPPSTPGQFINIGPRIGDRGAPLQPARPLLKRPFSIYSREDLAGGVARIDILYRVIGYGTGYLRALRSGDQTQAIAPLGRGFLVPEPLRTAVLIAGGTGLAPVAYLARQLRARSEVKVVLFEGARSAGWLPIRIDLAKPGPDPQVLSSDLPDIPIIIATDDGTAGQAGTVVDAAERWLRTNPLEAKTTCVYSCGPEVMMAAVAGLCERRGLACQVSLEKHMSCGMGTCQSCVVKVKDPADQDGWSYKLCCHDGPAFDAAGVIWG